MKQTGLNKYNNGDLTTRDSGKDESERLSLNTVFGDKIVSNRKANISAQFQYGLNPNKVKITLTGIGTTLIENSMLKIRTGASANSSAIVQTTDYLRYLPGHEGYCLLTVVFSTPKVGSKQRSGLYDGLNGFCFGYTDTQFEFVRMRNGVETKQNIDISKIYDDGSFDPTKGNLYRISFAYLGYGTITLQVATKDGGRKTISRFEYPNTSIDTHIAQTLLPVRGEIVNTTNNTNLEMRCGSLSAGIIDGSIIAGSASDVSARFFAKRATPKTGTSGVMIAFRNKATFKTIENRVKALLKLISLSSDGTKSVEFRLLKNPSFVSATWSDANTDLSVLEFSENMVLSAGAENGEAYMTWNMAKVDTFFENVEGQGLLLPPGETAVFYFTSPNSTIIDLSIRRAELF